MTRKRRTEEEEEGKLLTSMRIINRNVYTLNGREEAREREEERAMFTSMIDW